MVTSKEIGKIFKEAREERGMSLEQAYKACRIHSSVIVDIENGVFDRLGKLYIKSFLKKYSDFLGLDTDDILKKYASLSKEAPSREFDLGIKEKKEEKSPEKAVFAEKKAEIALVAALSVILVVLVFVLVLKVRDKFSGERAEIASTTAVTQESPSEEKKPVAARRIFASAPATKNAPLVLTLKARGKVWIRVKDDNRTLFDGFLDKGDSKTLESDEPLTVWTGKAEYLDFVVNTRKLGVVANGVIKNIVVSSGGVKIGGEWVARID